MTRSRIFLMLTVVLGFLLLVSNGQGNQRSNLAERLGYSGDAKLLIVHADDVGVSHSVNQATFDALETGLVNSASIMMPCPWVPEVAEYAARHPETDFGLHLTLTAEWRLYKWGSVAPAEKVSSLLSPLGYFYPSVEEAVAHIDPAEAEIEIRAQIEQARAMGIEPTHLDSHMGTLFNTPELAQVYLSIGREYGLPVLVPGNLIGWTPHFKGLLAPEDIVIDQLAMLGDSVPASEWPAFYTDLVRGLRPGVTEIIVHLAYDNAEMQAVTYEHLDFGSAWRQRDFDFFTSDPFRRLLDEEGIELITWREIKEKLLPE